MDRRASIHRPELLCNPVKTISCIQQTQELQGLNVTAYWLKFKEIIIDNSLVF